MVALSRWDAEAERWLKDAVEDLAVAEAPENLTLRRFMLSLAAGGGESPQIRPI
ncbi:MAG: hypothetical protein QXK94_08300 [Candidatus Jordarchaeales archaeon]